MFHRSPLRARRAVSTAGLLGAVVVLAACGTATESASTTDSTPAAADSSAPASDSTHPAAATADAATTGATTAGASDPTRGQTSGAHDHGAGDRLTVTYDGGILVLDAETLETVADLELDGFNRLNTAGDGEHVYVTTEGGFRVLATGAHGGEAALTELTFPATTPGHVVRHAGVTALFDDGTGRIDLFPTDALLDGTGTVATLPQSRVVESAEAHHGVAVELGDGTLLATVGNSESRVGVRALDATGTEVARFEQCPSVHGEGVVAGEAVVFGCQDGLLTYADGTFTKLDSPDDFGRIGNAYVSENSPIAVVDYKDDPDAEGVELSHVALADTAALPDTSLTVLDLPADVFYTWRGIGRDSHDDAWILGTDGALHRLDVAAGALAESHPVIEPWRGPAEWQTAHPALVVDGDFAYVTEPATQSVHRVDLHSGEVLATADLGTAANEIALVTNG